MTELVDIDESAADLEGPGGGVVLVPHPDSGPDARIEERPAVLGRRRHGTINELRRRFEVNERGQFVATKLFHSGGKSVAGRESGSRWHPGKMCRGAENRH